MFVTRARRGVCARVCMHAVINNYLWKLNRLGFNEAAPQFTIKLIQVIDSCHF